MNRKWLTPIMMANLQRSTGPKIRTIESLKQYLKENSNIAEPSFVAKVLNDNNFPFFMTKTNDFIFYSKNDNVIVHMMFYESRRKKNFYAHFREISKEYLLTAIERAEAYADEEIQTAWGLKKILKEAKK